MSCFRTIYCYYHYVITYQSMWLFLAGSDEVILACVRNVVDTLNEVNTFFKKSYSVILIHLVSVCKGVLFCWPLLLNENTENDFPRSPILGNSQGAGMAQRWEHLPPTSVAQVWFLDTASYVGWVCCLFSSLLWEVFLWVLQFSLSSKSQHFQILDTADKEPQCGCTTANSYLFTLLEFCVSKVYKMFELKQIEKETFCWSLLWNIINRTYRYWGMGAVF